MFFEEKKMCWLKVILVFGPCFSGTYLIVCFTLFVVARFTPNEWLAPPPCAGDEGVLENQFSFANSVWFITGTFLRQGSGLNPKVRCNYAVKKVNGVVWCTCVERVCVGSLVLLWSSYNYRQSSFHCHLHSLIGTICDPFLLEKLPFMTTLMGVRN